MIGSVVTSSDLRPGYQFPGILPPFIPPTASVSNVEYVFKLLMDLIRIAESGGEKALMMAINHARMISDYTGYEDCPNSVYQNVNDANIILKLFAENGNQLLDFAARKG